MWGPEALRATPPFACVQVTLIAQLLCHLRPLARYTSPEQVPADDPELLSRLAEMVLRPTAAMATEAGQRGFRALVAQLLGPPSPTGEPGCRHDLMSFQQTPCGCVPLHAGIRCRDVGWELSRCSCLLSCLKALTDSC